MKTKIILEIGCNHNGSVTVAKQMIREAAKLGVWAVKFQKRDIESIPESKKKELRNPENSFGATFYEHRKALEFDADTMAVLKKYTEEKGLQFVCSAFDLKSAQVLNNIGCKYIKLPSQLYLNHRLYKYLNRHYRGIVFVSTGMHTLREVYSSAWIRTQKAKVFHCVSEYPVPRYGVQFGVFKYCHFDGYSSHEEGGHACALAVVSGIDYIERHFTMDKEAKGSDHKMSSDVWEMRRIISEIEEIEKYMGDRKLSEAEKKTALIYRGKHEN